MISSPSDVTVSKIEFGPVKMLDSGGKTVNLRYEGRNLMLETPSLNVPYGVNVFDKTGPPKYSVDLSLRGVEDNEKIKALQTFLEEFDERMLDAGVENAGKWFKMTNPNREVIKAFYTPLLKYSRDPQGNLKPYPPTLKVNLRRKKDATAATASCFETSFYNPAEKDAKGVISQFPSDMPIEQVLAKRSMVTTIIQCTGVWFAGGKFGTTWKAVQARVDTQPEQIRGPAFRSDAPDIRTFVSKAIVAKASAGSGSGYGGEDEDDEDDAEEEVEVVKAPAPAPAPASKVVAPAPAPAPAFDDEAVAEPLPVPKKVVKKVVPKAKA
jgi:hypothetical protein